MQFCLKLRTSANFDFVSLFCRELVLNLLYQPSYESDLILAAWAYRYCSKAYPWMR